MNQKSLDDVLDAAAHLVVEDGFDAVSIPAIAANADVDPDAIIEAYTSLDHLLVAMLNREYSRMWHTIVGDVERDPRGGLLSHIYRYTLTGVYERPLAKALYLADRDGLNRIMRSSHGFSYIPQVGVRSSFIETMKQAGMVRPEVDAERLSAVLSAVAAGAALTSPHGSQLDLVTEGLVALLVSGVDADVVDTTPGKRVFIEYGTGLAAPPAAE